MKLRSKLRRQKRLHDVAVLISILVLVTFAGLTVKDHMFVSIQAVFNPEPVKEVSYKVGAGDTLWLLAGSVVESGEDVRDKIIAIRQLNGLAPTQNLVPGQVVRIPVKNRYDQEYRYTLRDVR